MEDDPTPPTDLSWATSHELVVELSRRNQALIVIMMQDARDGDGDDIKKYFFGGAVTCIGLMRIFVRQLENVILYGDDDVLPADHDDLDEG